MRLNTKEVLKKIDKHLRRMDNIIKEDKEFNEEHQEVLDLCDEIFPRKSDYKEINIDYPDNHSTTITRPNGEVIDLSSFGNSIRRGLSKNIKKVLLKAKKRYLLKIELEKI